MEVNRNQPVNYVLQGLLPSTLYGVSARCRPSLDPWILWSLWSAEVKCRTMETGRSSSFRSFKAQPSCLLCATERISNLTDGHCPSSLRSA